MSNEIRDKAMKIVKIAEKDHDTAKMMLLYLIRSQIQSWYGLKLSFAEIVEELDTVLNKEKLGWIDLKNETFEKMEG